LALLGRQLTSVFLDLILLAAYLIQAGDVLADTVLILN
jgi:hypothetical protein